MELDKLDPLSRIAYDINCGKYTLCEFTPHYERLFNGFREEEFNLFEIGIGEGQSLRLWEKYFPKAHIFAIDSDSRTLKYSSERSHTYYMNQCDKPKLFELIDYIGKCKIICDDGSHEAPDMIASLEVLYPYLTDDGYYIIEDILDENKKAIYGYLETIPHKVVARGVARYWKTIDMVVIQKCSKT